MKLIASVFVFMLNIILTADCKAARLPNLSINDSSVALVHKSLELLFKAIEKMLLFYKREYKNMIIDGVYGLRVLEGVSNLILQENQKGELRIPILKKKRILKLGITSSKIAHKTYPYLRKFDSNYFDIMGFTVFEPWTNIGTLKSLNKNHSDLTESKMEELEMNEEKQDSCFNSLTGNPKKDIKPCTISDECWKTNTAPGQKSYYLTHQLLYILLGQVKGGCEVHSSGVGLGLMALYLRWLIHVAFSQSPRHKFHQQYLKHNQFHGSDNLMFFFVVVAATMTFLMILSKKFGLRFHRIKIIRTICPFI